MEIKILITGGHHTAALALLPALKRELEKCGHGLSVFWVGHRFSMRGDTNESLEYQEITQLKIPFFELSTPKFHRRSLPLTLTGLASGTARAAAILFLIRPKLIVSFGGYLAVPTVLAAWLLRIPSVTHEQTAEAGFANRLISRFCQKVYVSYASSRRYLPARKTVITGNPLREDVSADRGLYQFENEKKVVYITGGKQGAHSLNILVRQSLPELLTKYNVIHQCGSVSLHKDFENLVNFREGLPPEAKKSYIVKPHFYFSEIGSVFARANLVVSRAGANTVCELANLKKRSVLIPLPGSSHGEQERNARLLEKTGLAVVLPQEEANPQTLVQSLSEVERKAVNEEVLSQEFLPDAAGNLAREIAQVLKTPKP